MTHIDTITILPIGAIDEAVLQRIMAVVEQKFKSRATAAEPVPIPNTAFNAARRQYNGGRLLKELQRYYAGYTGKLLGVTGVDIYSPGLNYVFGQAVLGGCCGIISLSRLRKGIDVQGGRERFYSRIEKEAVHELGHMFGLRHCPTPTCVMFFSSNLADTDRKSVDFCAECGLPNVA